MKSDEWIDVMLPPNYHYHGMNKIKAGKGYQDGKAVGVEEGNCTECGGQICKLQMNTSPKGFETTSEKVCKECGLVEGGPFMIMESHTPDEPPTLQKYHVETQEEDLALRKYYNSKGEEIYNKREVSIFDVGRGREVHVHPVNRPDGPPEIVKTMYDIEYDYYYQNYKEWMEAQDMPKGLPTLQDADLKTNDNGDTELPEPLMDIYDWTKKEIKLGYELNLRNPKRAVLNRRPAEEVTAYNVGQQKRYADVVASQLQLNKLQREQIEYVIDTVPNILKARHHTYEDTILCLCIYVASLSVNNSRISVMKRNIPAWKEDYSRLYQLIKEKLSNVPI